MPFHSVHFIAKSEALPLEGLGQYPGVVLDESMYVAVFGQLDETQNGFYHPRKGPWVRTDELPVGASIPPLVRVGVTLPAFWVVPHDTCWLVVSKGPEDAIVGTDPIQAILYR